MLDYANWTKADLIKFSGARPRPTLVFETFNIFCKIRAKDTKHAKDVIFMIDDIDGVYRTETMISLEESINDKKRLMHTIFKNM